MPRSLIVGSQEHKELFCQFFLDTHVAFDPAAISWPEIDEDSLKRLHSLPVWNEAVATERAATRTIQAWVPFESDALIREAIALQGHEEARHAAIIQGLTTHYGIPVSPPPPPAPADPEWAFMRLGYSECFDAFFTLPCLRLPEIRVFSQRRSLRSSSLSCKKRRVIYSFLLIGKPIARCRGRSGSARALSGVGLWGESCRYGVVCKALWGHVLTRISP
jgi:hypothetical protein